MEYPYYRCLDEEKTDDTVWRKRENISRETEVKRASPFLTWTWS